MATFEESMALTKELKKRGWKFVGPTTMYAFMQAMGMVNDHADGCALWVKGMGLRAELGIPLTEERYLISTMLTMQAAHYAGGSVNTRCIEM
jgi:hypothetical protein